MIDEILAELGNESEIHNGSILLFLHIDNQEVSPPYPNAPFKSLVLICHEKEQEQRRKKICTTEDLSEGFKELESVRWKIENRRLPKSFNDRAFHINKADEFNNDNKMSASGNHSSSETTVEQKLDIPDNSRGGNFPNSLMSVNYVYNFDAHPWPKNTILIAGDSMTLCFDTHLTKFVTE